MLDKGGNWRLSMVLELWFGEAGEEGNQEGGGGATVRIGMLAFIADFSRPWCMLTCCQLK